MFCQHLSAKFVNFDLPRDFKPCSFKPKIESSYPGKETADFHRAPFAANFTALRSQFLNAACQSIYVAPVAKLRSLNAESSA